MSDRGFEIISKYDKCGINLPVRATRSSAGYDFEAAEQITIPSLFQQIKLGKNGDAKAMKPTLVPTGIKAYMNDDEYLQLANRSSNPLKRFLILANGIGVIDADYYNNPSNEGHIMFQFINFGSFSITIKKGEKIGQGIFHKFLKVENDSTTQKRISGFGSTDRKIGV